MLQKKHYFGTSHREGGDIHETYRNQSIFFQTQPLDDPQALTQVAHVAHGRAGLERPLGSGLSSEDQQGIIDNAQLFHHRDPEKEI